MPLYTYTDNKTGAATVRMVAIAERDLQPGLTRVFEAPSAVKVVNPSAGGRLTQQAQQVLAGYRHLEEKGELRKTRTEASDIKEAWRTDTDDANATDNQEN